MTYERWRRALHGAICASHAALILGTLAWSFSLRVPGPLPAVLIALLLIPLLLTIRGLVADQRYTYQWLSVVLVVFVGASATEVVASLRAAPAAVAVMVFSAVELLSVLLRLRLSSRRFRA